MLQCSYRHHQDPYPKIIRVHWLCMATLHHCHFWNLQEGRLPCFLQGSHASCPPCRSWSGRHLCCLRKGQGLARNYPGQGTRERVDCASRSEIRSYLHYRLCNHVHTHKLEDLKKNSTFYTHHSQLYVSFLSSFLTLSLCHVHTPPPFLSLLLAQQTL